MAIPSSGPLTLSDIQTEFGGSNPISLNEYYAGGAYVPAGTTGTYGAVPSSGEISIRNFYGTTAFTAVFNNAENISVINGQQTTDPLTAAYIVNTDATCTKANGTSYGNAGPTAWGTPTGGTPGNSFEARINVSAAYVTPGYGNYAQFAGVNIPDGFTGYTSWYALSSNRSLFVYCDGQNVAIQGTLYIRNTTSLVEISRAIYVGADQTV
jgi:hypothetical protein